MRSISVTWASEIAQDQVIVFINGIHETIKIAYQQLPEEGSLVPFPEIRLFGDWILQSTDQAHPVEPEMDYASFRWYHETALDPQTRTLRVDRFLELMVNEPWQQDTPHYDMSLVHLPMLDENRHSVLGKAVRGRAAVISTHALHTIQDSTQRLILLRRLAMHYMGQVLAVPISGKRTATAHTGICVMRPADNLPMLIAYTQQELETQVTFCSQCQIEMGQRLIGSHLGNN